MIKFYIYICFKSLCEYIYELISEEVTIYVISN